MRDMLVIARRELLERVRSKWFLVITLLGPIGMVSMIVIQALIAGGSTAGTRIEIIDQTVGCLSPKKLACELGKPLAEALEKTEWKVGLVDPATPLETELDKVAKNAISGFLVIPKDALAGGEIVYRGDNASNQKVQYILREVIKAVVGGGRGRWLDLDKEALEKLGRPIPIDFQHSTGEAQGASGLTTFFLGYILSFILYMVITLYGVGVMRSVVQEKTSRVMEMMVAAVKPRSLMGGKILGVGTAGLIQVTVWLAMGAITLTYRDTIAGWFGASGGGMTLPPLAFADIVVVLAFFIMGFFFYASMYAAVGAMVSSDEEMQQVQLPVTMLLVIGIVSLQVVSNAPRGGSAQLMTTIPLWSPILMPMRYVLGGASLADVALSLGILVIATALVVRVAAKIYRTGVLMYGKRPSLSEVLRWLRY